MSYCVCVSAHISQKRHVQTSRNSLYVFSVVVARSFSDDNVIRYVLPVLWMTLCLHITDDVALGVGRDDVDAVLRQVVKISSVFARSRQAV